MASLGILGDRSEFFGFLLVAGGLQGVSGIYIHRGIGILWALLDTLRASCQII